MQNTEVTTTGTGASGIRGSHGGTGNIDIDLRDVDITTEGRDADGVYGIHVGDEGNVRIRAQGGEITTMGQDAEAIRATLDGTGVIGIDAQGTDITTTGGEAEAILAIHSGEGEIEMSLRKLTIQTQGTNSGGVHGLHQRDSDGGVAIGVQDTEVTTTGAGAYGIRGSHGGRGDIELELSDVSITTHERNADGVHGFHVGEEGAVRIRVQGGEITTMGQESEAVRGDHEGAGVIGIDLQGTDITTTGDQAEAVIAIHTDAGDIEMSLREVTLRTEGEGAIGVHGLHRDTGEIRIKAQGGSITTIGATAGGIQGSHGGTGSMDINLNDVDIATEGENADGVHGIHVGEEGAVRIRVQGGEITTMGQEAEAFLAIHQGAGEIEMVVRNALIQTEGEGAEGVHGLHRDAGDIRIHTQGVEITTTGAAASGVRASHGDRGDLEVDSRNTSITTSNANAHGIVAYHGGSGSIRIAVDGGSIHAAGIGASGVRVGEANSRGQVRLAAEVGEDGYRNQSVTVNGSVTGGSGRDAAGVFLAGGGKVSIGPRGSLGAESGVAIRAAGDAPKLLVDMNPDGRRVAQVIGEDHIRNDGGETTLLINGVTLHDGASGATGLEAPNGAWDVTLHDEPTAVAGRVFSHNDFTAVYAPRAAVYEALPGLLLRLNGREPLGKRIASPESPVWVRLSNGGGSYEAERASVGAKYEFNYFGAEAGMSFSLGENLGGSISARYINGSAEVESPVGNGEIDTQGIGLGFGASWKNDSGYYAASRAVLTDYDVDASTEKRGELSNNGGARGYALALEAGRRIELDEKILGRKMKLTPRAWMRGSGFLNAEFTDAVNSRVSVSDTARLTGALGLVAQTARTWDEGALSLRVSLDVEQTLGDAETTTKVSGERLSSESARTRVLLGLGGAYRQGPFSLGAEFAADGLGSDDEEYSGRVDFGMKF